MKRCVFIIKGFSNSIEELELDRYYAGCYGSFFCDKSGGAYEKKDIIYLEDVTTKELNQTVKYLKLDFVVIVFIGHGANQKNNQLFQLNKEEVIKLGQIKINANKTLILIESCRNKTENVFTVDLNDKIPKYEDGGVVRNPINRAEARLLYDEQIIRCNNGTVVCFACSENEEAVNYYFSLLLIQNGFNWHLNRYNRNCTLDILDLMQISRQQVNQLAIENTNQSQNPQYLGSENFPFAVSKFQNNESNQYKSFWAE